MIVPREGAEVDPFFQIKEKRAGQNLCNGAKYGMVRELKQRITGGSAARR
jgi:hypothetical protein